MISIFRVGQRIILRLGSRKITSRVSSYQSDWISVNLASSVALERGTVCEVACTTPGCSLLYFMQVLRTPEDTGREVVLRRNPRAGGNFNRRGWRVAVGLNAAIRRNGSPHFIDGVVHNLSMEGALVQTQARLSVNDTVDLKIDLKEGRPVLVNARVCRLEALQSAQGPSFRAGLEFTHVPGESRRALTMHLWRILREAHMNRKRERENGGA
ncbi:MAG: PilZ domain-containing protein [Candidatus Hydrogenedentes bacterium]|nr:PilZ domain-containing protein [Candidatus Hydrogenedentota bacterium]